MLLCTFCNKECKNNNSLRNHQRMCKLNPDRKIRIYDFSIRKHSNQYKKAKELGLQKPKISKEALERIADTNRKRGQTESVKIKMSKLAKERGLGGVSQSRRIRYKDKILGSTYELIVAQSLDENNIRWDTCKKFNYVDRNGKHRTYTPDMYLIDYNIYLDPKNDYLINNNNPSLGFSDEEKINKVCDQNKIKVLILNKNQLCWNEIIKLLK